MHALSSSAFTRNLRRNEVLGGLGTRNQAPLKFLFVSNLNNANSRTLPRAWQTSSAADEVGSPLNLGLLPPEAAALYELPFEYILKTVKPERDTNRRDVRKKKLVAPR